MKNTLGIVLAVVVAFAMGFAGYEVASHLTEVRDSHDLEIAQNASINTIIVLQNDLFQRGLDAEFPWILEDGSVNSISYRNIFLQLNNNTGTN